MVQRGRKKEADAGHGTPTTVPLLYLSFSRFLRVDDERAERMTAIADLLLKRGADPSIKNSVGMTAADYATQRGHIELAQSLSPGDHTP